MIDQALKSGPLSSSLMPFLNPRIARPKLLPNSGRRLAPKIKKAIKKMIMSSCEPIPNIGIASCLQSDEGVKNKELKEKRMLFYSTTKNGDELVKKEGLKRGGGKRATKGKGKTERGKWPRETQGKYLCFIFIIGQEIFLLKNLKGWNGRKESNF